MFKWEEKQSKTSQTNDYMREDVEFSLITYKDLIKEIKIGEGPHLSSLYELKNITTTTNKETFLKYLRNQILQYDAPLQFAQSVEHF